MTTLLSKKPIIIKSIKYEYSTALAVEAIADGVENGNFNNTGIKKMIVPKLFGVIFILIGIYIFKIGLTINDKVGHNLMNIRIIGAAFLLFGAGIGLIFTSKSLCETLGIFC